MITDKVELLEICEKLKFVKDCIIPEQTFYFYMWKGILDKTIFTYASYNDKKMTGCVVFYLARDLKDTILTLIFIWLDSKYPKLREEYMKFACEKAKELGANKLQVNTGRNPKVIERVLGKYGFEQRYVIFEREV